MGERLIIRMPPMSQEDYLRLAQDITTYRDAIVAAERAGIRAAVEGLRVRGSVRNETPWQNGFRQSRNETVAAVLDLLEEKP